MTADDARLGDASIHVQRDGDVLLGNAHTRLKLVITVPVIDSPAVQDRTRRPAGDAFLPHRLVVAMQRAEHHPWRLESVTANGVCGDRRWRTATALEELDPWIAEVAHHLVQQANAYDLTLTTAADPAATS